MKKSLSLLAIFYAVVLVACSSDTSVDIVDNLGNVDVGVGIGVSLDKDNDSVKDNVDLCPDSPEGFVSTRTVDADGDGCQDSSEDRDQGTGADADNDGIRNLDRNDNPLDLCPRSQYGWQSTSSSDADSDGCQDDTEDPDAGGKDPDTDSNGLIDIFNFAQLNNIRYNLAGDSYKTNNEPGNTGNSTGCPSSGCNGYELARDLILPELTSIEIKTWQQVGSCGEDLVCGGTSSADDEIFSATFNGNNHTIGNIVISGSTKYTGFFTAISGTILDLVFANGSVFSSYQAEDADNPSYTGTLVGWAQNGSNIDNVSSDFDFDTKDSNYSIVGGLVGLNEGTISNSHTNSNIDGGSGNDGITGGIVGYNSSQGILINDYTTGNITGNAGNNDIVGGIVGVNKGTLEDVRATGNISGGTGDNDTAGGIVGLNNGTLVEGITRLGVITGNAGSYDYVGGIVGVNTGTIQNSSAFVEVNGNEGDSDHVGGLVGLNNDMVINSYALGNVSGNDGSYDKVGGLVGLNSGTTQNSYATGSANGGAGGADQVGGVAGWNNGNLVNSYATGDVTGGEGLNNKVGKLIGDKKFSSIISGNYYYVSSVLTVSENDIETLTAVTEAMQLTDSEFKNMTSLDTEADFGTDNGWNAFNWNFTTGKYPSLKSYQESNGAQKDGSIICNQPRETHVQCIP